MKVLEGGVVFFLALMFLFLPLENPYRYSLGLFNLVPFRVCLALGLALAGAAVLWSPPDLKKLPASLGLPAKAVALLAALAVINAAATLWSPDARRGALMLADWLAVLFLFMFVVLLSRKSGPVAKAVDSHVFAAAFSLAGAVCLLAHVVQWLPLSVPMFDTIWYPKGPGMTVVYDPNMLANFLALSAILTVYLAASAKPWGWKAALGVLACLEVWLLICTRSRSGIGAFAISSLVFTFLLGVRRHRAEAIGLAVVLAVAASFLPAFFSKPDSTSLHVKFLESHWYLFLKHPMGVGLGGYSEALRATPFASQFEAFQRFSLAANVNAHSTWGRVLSETGVAGILLYVALLGLMVRRLASLSFYCEEGKRRMLAGACLAGLIGLQAAAVVQSFQQEWFWLFMFLCLWVAVGSENKAEAVRA